MKVLDAKKYCVVLGILWVAVAVITVLTPIIAQMNAGVPMMEAFFQLLWSVWATAILCIAVAVSYFLVFASVPKLLYIRVGAFALLAIVQVAGIRVFDLRLVMPSILAAIGYALYAVFHLELMKLPRWTAFVPAVVLAASVVSIMFAPYGFIMSSFALGVVRAVIYAAYSVLLFLPSLMNKD